MAKSSKMSRAEQRIWAYLTKYPTAEAADVVMNCDVTLGEAQKCIDRIGTPRDRLARPDPVDSSSVVDMLGLAHNNPPDPPLALRAQLLREAETTTMGDRERDYGTPVANFERAADIYNTFRGVDRAALSAADIVRVMLSVKLSRARTSPLKRDHYVDLMAYLGILYECVVSEDEADKYLDELVDAALGGYDV